MIRGSWEATTDPTRPCAFLTYKRKPGGKERGQKERDKGEQGAQERRERERERERRIKIRRAEAYVHSLTFDALWFFPSAPSALGSIFLRCHCQPSTKSIGPHLEGDGLCVLSTSITISEKMDTQVNTQWKTSKEIAIRWEEDAPSFMIEVNIESIFCRHRMCILYFV